MKNPNVLKRISHMWVPNPNPNDVLEIRTLVHMLYHKKSLSFRQASVINMCIADFLETGAWPDFESVMEEMR